MSKLAASQVRRPHRIMAIRAPVPEPPSAGRIAPLTGAAALLTRKAITSAGNMTRLGYGLRPRKFEHRNGADSSSSACVLGKAWVAPGLLGVDAVAFSAGQFRTVTLYVSVRRSTLPLPAAVKLWYQSGLVGAPPLVAKT